MSGEKISVKKLAEMFDLTPQAMKSELQTIGLEVKTISSSIPASAIGKVKAHLKSDPKAGTEETSVSVNEAEVSDAQASGSVERKEVQPGVIIRRRRVKETDEPVADSVAAVPSSDDKVEIEEPAQTVLDADEEKVETKPEVKAPKKDKAPKEPPATAKIMNKRPPKQLKSKSKKSKV